MLKLTNSLPVNKGLTYIAVVEKNEDESQPAVNSEIFRSHISRPMKRADLRSVLDSVTNRLIDKTSLPTPAPVKEEISRSDSIPRILIAEDNIPSQKMVIIFLKKFDYFVEGVDNGYDALKKLEENAFDILFLDIHMAGLNGFDVTKAIRKSNSNVINPGIPIIAMTADALPEDRKACLDAGMTDFMPKPIKQMKMKEMVEKYCSDESNVADSNGFAAVKFNPRSLMDQLDHDQDLYRSIITAFVADIPNKFSAISAALHNNDSQKLCISAHSIKGAAINVGAMSMHALANELEDAGKDSDFNRSHKLFELIQKDYSLLKQEINTSITT